MPKPPPQWNKRLGALCSTCHHPEAYHNRKLNYPTVPWQFIDGECCCGMGLVRQMREVKQSRRKLEKLAKHIHWRHTTGYMNTRAHGKGPTDEGMTLRDARDTATAITQSMFRAPYISPYYGVRVSRTVGKKRYVCGCRKFTI